MLGRHALCGVSIVAIHVAWIAHAGLAHGQSAEPAALPPVNVEAPREGQARPVPPKRSGTAAAGPRRMQPASAPSERQLPVVVINTSSMGAGNLYQAPNGQTGTTIDRSQFDNRPAFSVADVLRDSPGISIKQGNGPRDFGISIRGSNARNGFGIRNMVIFDDGFPVTQPDGLSRSDLIDPHAYGAIDVIRGPSSALYGNYATGGAINFRTRPGREIDGFEYGVDGGSFGYLNNYLSAGKKIGNFEYTFFGSDVRGDGYIQNSWFNTQTVNFVSTLQATPDDRLTFKLIHNDLFARLPVRLSLNQYYQNPFQAGCETPGTVGCGTVSLFNNGFNGTRTPFTSIVAGLGRNDRRTIVGGRWEHDFDNQTIWRNQFVFDDRNINQPTGTTSAIGDFASYNFVSDVTRRGEIFGMDTTTYVGAFYNTLPWSSDTRNVVPGGNATQGRIVANTTASHTNWGFRAREEIKLAPTLTAIAGVGWEQTNLWGINTAYTYTGAAPVITTGLTGADRQFQNTAPEVALLFKPDSEWQFRARVGTGYGTPQVGNLFVISSGQFGNNTQLNAQRNIGYDLGADWTPNNALKVSLTGFYEFFRDELVTQATPAGAPNTSYTFNAPRSEHRGVELAVDWRFLPTWRLTAAYTYLDEFYTEYVEKITNGTTYSFNRVGNKIPGISPNELTARLSWDETSGPLRGLGAFVEVVWKDSFYMENANLLKAPGYELVNANVHYKTELASGSLKSLSLFLEVRNLLDRTYVASANNIGNTVTAAGVQNPASVLAATAGSIYAGAPRAFVAGMKIAFR
ncbi:TonB-dependent receptor [Bradyrhizobium sp.]|uniref:TonB-dependent receptor family protein n=1 Tax=Bradyrhizobium sp. TaxID=376 RepID=UPI001DB94B9D|nr:TonB-dependent receptor [Bradyrhizobium sp.]MBI5319842.1 TonB-dependent receptor [Bradyrhizobium sp.]